MAEDNPVALLGDLESLTKDPKALRDFAKETDVLLERNDTLAKSGRGLEDLDAILHLEKQTRQACDAISGSRLCCRALRLFKDSNDWPAVATHVTLLCKKRGQLKRVIADMVQLAAGWIETLKDKETKVMLIDTLSAVTDGKIFVEVERARLTRMLAQMKEEEGNVEEAAILLQEVQVETFGAMDRLEKASYIVEQMRLVLRRNDFIRCQILSKKLNKKLMNSLEFEPIREAFVKLMITFHLHEEETLEVAKYHLELMEIETNRSVRIKDLLHPPPEGKESVLLDGKDTKKDEKKPIESSNTSSSSLTCSSFPLPVLEISEESYLKHEALARSYMENSLFFLLLAPYNTEQQSLLVQMFDAQHRRLKELPLLRTFVSAFLTVELISWPLLKGGAALKDHPVFQDAPYPGGEKRWGLLRRRVLQHSIKVVASYYERIRHERLAELIGVGTDEVELEISELVCNKTLFAKLDRPAGIVSFRVKDQPCQALEQWTGAVKQVLDLVDESTLLIQKENMVHAAKTKRLMMEHKGPANTAQVN
eukprot:GHVT01047914.1.p1 GENE.GHVT01047914.1~~GHVT01047914.1.p1  ORF type:complete len:537 (+),score=115.78 GHVT01047914.1:365-1975(+)